SNRGPHIRDYFQKTESTWNGETDIHLYTMFALAPKADIRTQSWNVRLVPKADMWRCINSANSRELTLGGNEMTNSSTSHTISPEHIMQIGLGFWASKTLLSAVEMELFTHLSKRPGTVETLQGQLGLHPRSARDFLDALVALGFLERKDGVYHNTAAVDQFLD